MIRAVQIWSRLPLVAYTTSQEACKGLRIGQASFASHLSAFLSQQLFKLTYLLLDNVLFY